MNYYDVEITKFTEEEKENIVQEYLPRIKIWAMRAKSLLPASVDVDELYSAASLGFIECLNKFDKSRNTSFSTYVEYRVKGAILDALRGLDFLSRNARSKVKELETATEDLRNKLGRSPLPSEIAKHMDISEDDLGKVYDFQLADKPLRLDEVLNDEDGFALIDLIQSTDLSPEDSIIKENIVARLAEEIDKLEKKEQLVVSLYYYEELTMKEIAQVLELTESRISQIHTLAISKLRKKLNFIL